ncbi:hypothetical protein W97_07135 [Coniosporium apollinis CBS 100218]|uniref:Phytanoyl-CoA dioxygenase n=1 Tax=Coniosporium apollinis (strain CBS 100218) TaxID=1168221 RepID=R7Z1R7_CONA1|nr:uncharacterized protein W97_07135 [Coniosporium apollinis CBS 100218]EON67989.1 hypothetical protein W97_07135 [Coniosporium apollinis CBS 100218]
MDTKAALRDICNRIPLLTAEQTHSLDENGYFVIYDVFTASQCQAISDTFDQLTAAEASNPGLVIDAEEGATRLSDLFNKSNVFDPVLSIQPVLGASHYLLGEFKLHGANMREPHAGHGHQPLHSDVLKSSVDDWRLVNALICIDDMDDSNGPTRMVPGSHRWPHLNVPEPNLEEWEQDARRNGDYGDTSRFPKDPLAPFPGQILFNAPKGAVVVCNASLWHGGTANVSGRHRRMLHLTYARRDLKQQFKQQDHITPALWERLSDAQRFLFDVKKPVAVE